MSDPRDQDETVRLDLAHLVDPNPTAYVERYRPPVPPPVRRRPEQDVSDHTGHGCFADPLRPHHVGPGQKADHRKHVHRPIDGDDGTTSV